MCVNVSVAIHLIINLESQEHVAKQNGTQIVVMNSTMK